jgi:hypothetical protein
MKSLMAFRVTEESVVRGSVDNREKGVTTVRMEFADGFVTSLRLKGNPYRDLGGRLMAFENPTVDRALVHQDHLLHEGSGLTGDITASRKVRVPLIPIEDFYLARKRGETPPEEWRNSLYLEWYTLKRGRCVLEATTFTMRIEEAAWEMTDEEDEQAKKDAAGALTNFMEILISGVAPLGDLGEKEKLDEFEWEKFFKHSDKRTDQYGELLDKFGDASGEIDKHMGWDKKKREARLSDIDLPDEPEPWEGTEPEEHPLELHAQEVLESADWLLKEDEVKLELYSVIASVRVKIGGAMSMHEGAGVFEDNGFVVAYLKRVLSLIDEAVAGAGKVAPELTPKLLGLRSEVIDLQNNLRKRMS